MPLAGRDAFPHPAADQGEPVDWSALRRILVVRPDNLGDVVMLTPGLRALRASAPRARIDLLASPTGAALRPLMPDLDGLLTVAPSWQQIGDELSAPTRAADEQALVDTVAGRDYDAVLVFTSPTQSPWPAAHVAMLAGVRVRVAQSAEFAGALATHWVTPPPAGTHQVDRCLHLLSAVGVAALGRLPALRVPATACRAATDVLTPTSGPVALVMPGASCPSRRYPVDGFGAAARHLAGDGFDVLVSGTAAEDDLVHRVVGQADHPSVRALPVLSVPELCGVIEQAAVVVANNSGGMHLADALGTPVVVAWAGTERATDMEPRRVPSALLGQPVGCSPCRQFRCPYSHECLDVDPTLLATAAIELVADAQPGAAVGTDKEQTCHVP